jgi:hypothetical protein
VTWREGVHVTGTAIWCDARRRRDVCFVSSADRVGRVGHGQLIGTPITLAMLGGGAEHLAVPLRRRFTLGTVRLELLASGRGLGAAALHVELEGRRVLYAGAVRTTGADEVADLRACDAVVVAAPIGEARQHPGRRDDVAARLAGWARAHLAAGRRPIVAVDTALDGLEVATALAAHDLAIAGSRSLRDAALRVGALAALPPIRALGREPCTAIRVDGDRARVVEPTAIALVSLRAVEPQPGFDATFVWPFAADREQLLAWIEATGARDVFVTGTYAKAITTAIGARARVLGPPHQMTLFPREAAE